MKSSCLYRMDDHRWTAICYAVSFRHSPSLLMCHSHWLFSLPMKHWKCSNSFCFVDDSFKSCVEFHARLFWKRSEFFAPLILLSTWRWRVAGKLQISSAKFCSTKRGIAHWRRDRRRRNRVLPALSKHDATRVNTQCTLLFSAIIDAHKRNGSRS